MREKVNIIDYIEEIRNEHGLSIKDLTEGIVSERTYTRYLSKETDLQLQVLDQFLSRLSMPLFQFALYIQNSIIMNNLVEYEFYDLILAEKYKEAYQKLYPEIKHKELKTSLSEKSIPIGITLMHYYNNNITKFTMQEKVQKQMRLKELEERHILFSEDIESLKLYLRVCDDDEKTRISRLLYKVLFKKGSKIFTGNKEGTYTSLYYVLIATLTQRKTMNETDHRMIVKVFRHYLSFHKRSRMALYDVEIFNMMCAYYEAYDSSNNSLLFYCIALLLSSFDEPNADNVTKAFSKDEISVFLKYLDSMDFRHETMYERLMSNGGF